MSRLTELVDTYIPGIELSFQNIMSGINYTNLSEYRLINIDIKLADKMHISGDAKGEILLSIHRPNLSIKLSYDLNKEIYTNNMRIKNIEYLVVLKGINLNNHDTILSLSFHQINKDGKIIDHDGTIHPLE